MPCPEFANPAKTVWYMCSESATLRMLQTCFKFECTKRLVYEERKIFPHIDDIRQPFSSAGSIPLFFCRGLYLNAAYMQFQLGESAAFILDLTVWEIQLVTAGLAVLAPNTKKYRKGLFVRLLR